MCEPETARVTRRRPVAPALTMGQPASYGRKGDEGMKGRRDAAPAIGSRWYLWDGGTRYVFMVFMVAGGQVYMALEGFKGSTRSTPLETFFGRYRAEVV